MSLVPGNTSILVHFNRILTLCANKTIRAECLLGAPTHEELKRFFQSGPARLLYIIGHSSKEAGLFNSNIGFRHPTLAECLPRNRALLPDLIFLNTCYGQIHHAEELTRAGIGTVISTRKYITLDAALGYGATFVDSFLSGIPPRAIVDQVNKLYEGIASFQVTSIP